ncbi:MAG: GNAT family N-acetyltransferase [Pseudomonadota bacterium]
MSDTPTIEFSLAKPHHGQQLAEMSRRLVESGLPWWNWTPKRVGKAIRNRDNITLLARVGKRIAGFALIHVGEERGHLYLLAVEPEFRRLGIARDLIIWLEESCQVAGVLRIELEVRSANEGALRFYRSLGFDVSAQIPRYYCGREAATRMTKAIADLDYLPS